MSIVTKFSVYTHCNDLGGKVWNPAIKWTQKYAVFVVLENDGGTTGLGECWCFDAKPDSLVAYLKSEIAPHVLGIEVSRSAIVFEQLRSRATLTARHGMLSSAWSGVDIALWDIRSRDAKLPLWKYLQAQYPELDNTLSKDVCLYGSGGLYGKDKTSADLVEELQSINAAGFDLVKMKVGGLSLAEDIERVLAVLDAVDESCRLIIDGVYSYSVEQAQQIYSALPYQRIEAFQSPLKADDLAGMVALCEQGVPVMGIEAEYRHEIYQQLINQRAVHFLQLSPIACGGISQLFSLNKELLACNSEIRLSLEVSSTAVALKAAYHFGLACENVAHVERHFVHEVFFEELNFSVANDALKWRDNGDEFGIGISLENLSVLTEFELSV